MNSITIEGNNYYPFGLKHKGYNTIINGTHHKYMFGGKEFDESFQTLNTYDFGARNYDPALGRWMNIDPLAENSLSYNPYHYVTNNPIIYIDPDGRDWFYYRKEGEKEASWNWQEGNKYTHKYSYEDENGVTQNKEIELTGVQAAIVFDGAGGEKLGKGNNLYGEGSKLAEVTVYGPNGADDIQKYKGYSLSSDPNKYGMVKSNDEENPYYLGNYDAIGKSSILKSWWTINNRLRVPTEQEINPNVPNQIDANGRGYLLGIFIHRSNLNGYCGGNVSSGCPIIAPGIKKDGADWERFMKQMGSSKNSFGIKKFALQIFR